MLSPIALERLALRRDKFNERLSRLADALDGGNRPVAPFITDAFGEFSEELTKAFIDELVSSWGLHELYRSNWDFAAIASERDGDWTYEWEAYTAPAEDFLYCALRLVATCPWFFEGTIAEVRSLAAHLGDVPAPESAASQPFSIMDAYADMGNHASFFQNMEALKRLLACEESTAEIPGFEDEETSRPRSADDVPEQADAAGYAAEDSRWDDSAEQAQWIDKVESEGRAWKENFSDAAEILERYESFTRACREYPHFLDSFADDITFAFDVLFAVHGASLMLDDQAYFGTYQLVREAEGLLSGREVR